jgi:hypothetical protein
VQEVDLIEDNSYDMSKVMTQRVIPPVPAEKAVK